MIECTFFSFLVRGEGAEGKKGDKARDGVSPCCNDHADDSLYSYNVIFSKKKTKFSVFIYKFFF